MTFFSDIWKSFLGLKIWVRVWILLILGPINFSSLLFIGETGSVLIASLALAGIVFNAIPLWFERGFTDTMAIPHVIFWIPLLIILIAYLSGSETVLSNELSNELQNEIGGGYRYFLISLLLCNAISLAFDIPDALKWFKQRTKI